MFSFLIESENLVLAQQQSLFQVFTLSYYVKPFHLAGRDSR